MGSQMKKFVFVGVSKSKNLDIPYNITITSQSTIQDVLDEIEYNPTLFINESEFTSAKNKIADGIKRDIPMFLKLDGVQYMQFRVVDEPVNYVEEYTYD
jgi:hypothetical protein